MALTPDDPPTHFRWRGRLHRVRHAEGPERIGEEWWKQEIDDVRVLTEALLADAPRERGPASTP